ncbi:MAG: hypothetical protein IVW55_08030 [Chloroflexi bacterium]|nr:hypothetical protein [Chloroflexota bacterium]
MNLNNTAPAYGNALILMLALLTLFLILFVTYLWRSGYGRGKPGQHFFLRRIPAYDATRTGLARAAETGHAVHTSPGTGRVGAAGISTAATLAGLATVESMARVSAITGAPVQATTNDAVAFSLTDSALRRGYQRAGWSLEDDASGGARFLTHNDPLAYVAAAAEVVNQQKVTHAVMAGQFGPEVLLLTEAQRRTGAQQIAGSSEHQGLAILFITADYPLLGEEIFASGAYLEQRTTNIATLLAQDGLRWVLVALIIIGFILTNIGIDLTKIFSLYP